MDYIYLPADSYAREQFIRMITDAEVGNKDLRISVSTGRTERSRHVKVKIGHGMWSAPLYDSQDFSRD